MLSSAITRRLVTASMTTLLLLAALPAGVSAAAITVTTTSRVIADDGDCSITEAILAANHDASVVPLPGDPATSMETGCAAGNGADTIVLPASSVFTFSGSLLEYDNFVGPSATPVVTSPIVIDGRGARIERSPNSTLMRAFVVQGGDLVLHEVHIKGFGIRGGDGADGGGGGLGAGGAIYIEGGSLGIGWSTFEENFAEGGDGSYDDEIGGGGGGGLSGDGGEGRSGGGGGGGSRGDGAVAGGGGGTVTSAVGEEPGQRCGGRGGESDIVGANDGDDGSCPGGGGGGGSELIPIFDPFVGAAGGNGHYGGGGGGGGEDGNGGAGGFGGAGGGSGSASQGGDGGFGAGGGNGSSYGGIGGRGQGGTFGGDGGYFGGGGGGALGGAIFGHLATIEIQNSTFIGNQVTRGKSGDIGDLDPASDGRGAGGAIFTVAGSLRIDNSTIAGNTAGEWNDTPNGPDGLGGGGVVVYKPTTGDSASLRIRNTIVANNGPFECYARNGASLAGSTGNLITHSAVNSHDDVPCDGVVASDDPQLQSLTLNAPGRTPTMAIGAGSPAIDTADPAASTGDDQRGIVRPQGAGPDIGAYEDDGSGTPAIPPVTTITLSPATPNGSNGWYRTPVGVSITATDPDGTVAQTRCALDPASPPASFADLPNAACALTAVSTDGLHAIHAASVDTDGNAETPVAQAAVKVDQKKPTLAPTLSSATIVLGQSGVTAVPNATDATSGIASATCGAIDTASVGDRTVTCTATDVAGHTASAKVHYVVQYKIVGLSPTSNSSWRAGKNVPVKVAVVNAAGARISDAEGVRLALTCRVVFTATGAQGSGPRCMWYDAKGNQFVYDWSLSKKPFGTATTTVTVWYPGTTTVTRVNGTVTIVR